MNKGQRCKVQGSRNKRQVVSGKWHSGTMRLEPSNSQLFTLNSKLYSQSCAISHVLCFSDEIRFTRYGPSRYASRFTFHDFAVFSHRGQRKRDLHLCAFPGIAPKLNRPAVRLNDFLTLVQADPQPAGPTGL